MIVRHRQRVIAFISVGVSVGILGYWVWREKELIATMARSAQPVYLAGALGVQLVLLAVLTANWCAIVARLGPATVWSQNARAYAVTALIKRIPGPAWHVIGRLVWYNQHGTPKSVVLSASAVEFVLLSVTGLSVAIAALGLSVYRQMLPASAGMLLIGVGLALVPGWLRQCIAGDRLLAAIRHERLRQMVAPLTQVTAADLWRWSLTYAASWCLGGCSLFLLVGAFEPVSILWLPNVVGAAAVSITIASFLFVIPGAMVFREVLLATLLGQSLPSAVAVVIAVLFRVLSVAAELAWAAITFVRWPERTSEG